MTFSYVCMYEQQQAYKYLYSLSHAFELVDWGEKMEEEELQCHFLSCIIGMEYGGGGR